MSPQVVGTIATAIVALSAPFVHGQSKDLLRPPESTVTIRALAFSPDGQQLAGCMGELKSPGEVVVWDVKTNAVRWRQTIDKGVPAVAFSPDAKMLAVGSFTENCHLFDADTGKSQSTLAGHGEAARSLAFSPDGATLAIGSYDEAIRLWDWRAGKLLRTLTGQADKVYSLAYLPGGKMIASGGSSGSGCIWDADSGKLLHELRGDASPLAFDPKGQWLATAGNDSTVSFRSVGDYEKVLAQYDRIYAYRQLVIHPAGRSFVSHSGMDWVVSVFPIDLEKATPADEKRAAALIARWDEDSYEAREKASRELVEMGHTAKALLSKAAKDSPAAETRIRAREALRRLGAPKPLAKLRGHDDNVTAVSFSPDGRLLATASRDGLVLLWDAATYSRKSAIHWPKNERTGSKRLSE